MCDGLDGPFTKHRYEVVLKRPLAGRGAQRVMHVPNSVARILEAKARRDKRAYRRYRINLGQSVRRMAIRLKRSVKEKVDLSLLITAITSQWSTPHQRELCKLRRVDTIEEAIEATVGRLSIPLEDDEDFKKRVAKLEKEQAQDRAQWWAWEE